MHLISISGMGFLDRVFFSFALNTQNVSYLHTKSTRPRPGMRGERKRYGEKKKRTATESLGKRIKW